MAERVYAGMTAQERSSRRFEQFLGAGLEVFADRGWANGTVSDVCRVAGLSPRYFYELFGSREDLFHAVTARIAEDVRGLVRRAVSSEAPAASSFSSFSSSDSSDPEARARAVLQALADWFTADPRTIRVALMESLATPEFRGRRRELIESFGVLAAQLMRSLRGPGDGRDLTTSAAVLTGGLVEVLIGYATDPGPPASLDSLVEHLTALYTAAARM